MKVLHLSTSDTGGGAAIAALRLHRAMLADGIDSVFLCMDRNINDDSHILAVSRLARLKSGTFDTACNLLFQAGCVHHKRGVFSTFNIGYKAGKYVNLDEYDVIYIHWVNGGFLSLEGVEEICRTGRRIFWFMHDMFPITGGCHHSFECDKYMHECGVCPFLKRPGGHDFSYRQLEEKHRVLDKYKNLSFIAPSSWLYECTKSSSLGKMHDAHHIPNLLDTTVFRPLDKKECRDSLGLPANKKIVLFGAVSALTNPYKGFKYLVDALRILKDDDTIPSAGIHLVIFGAAYNANIARQLPFESTFMGVIRDDRSLALLYNSADVFCQPSLAENFANTVLEAAHCHTPVVGFNIGGIPDVVCDETGYLAAYRDSIDFARGIKECLSRSRLDTDGFLRQYSPARILSEHKKLWGQVE